MQQENPTITLKIEDMVYKFVKTANGVKLNDREIKLYEPLTEEQQEEYEELADIENDDLRKLNAKLYYAHDDFPEIDDSILTIAMIDTIIAVIIGFYPDVPLLLNYWIKGNTLNDNFVFTPNDNKSLDDYLIDALKEVAR